jgi:hypothetical protein
VAIIVQKNTRASLFGSIIAHASGDAKQAVDRG